MTRRPLMRVTAVADYIGQSPEWSRIALADGTIPGGRKVRGRWVIAKADVDAWSTPAARPGPSPRACPTSPIPAPCGRRPMPE